MNATRCRWKFANALAWVKTDRMAKARLVVINFNTRPNDPIFQQNISDRYILLGVLSLRMAKRKASKEAPSE